MKIKKNIYSIAALSLIALTAVSPVFAETNDQNTNQQNSARGNRGENRGGVRGMMKPGVFGTVTAISGNIITISGKQGFGTNTTTTTVYTVDATSAKITKNNTAGTINSIIVGDTISAQGTLTGTNIVATNIHDGLRGNGDKQNDNEKKPITNLNQITGNGQPIVAGTVTSVSGNTVVITNNSNVSYTIDATNAKIVQGQNTILVSGITVGDVVIVQGIVNGNSVVASSITDRVKQTNTTNTVKTNKGFFSMMGSFFGHMFGF